MRNLIIISLTGLFLLTVNCSGQKVGGKSTTNESVFNKELRILKKRGIKEYLIYKEGCLGCHIKQNCPCEDKELVEIVLFYKLDSKNMAQRFSCCKKEDAEIVDNKFFDTIEKYGIILKETAEREKRLFFPPVATDQPYQSFTFGNSDLKFEFSMSLRQMTEGTDENEAWSKIEIFKARKQIADYVLEVLKK